VRSLQEPRHRDETRKDKEEDGEEDVEENVNADNESDCLAAHGLKRAVVEGVAEGGPERRGSRHSVGCKTSKTEESNEPNDAEQTQRAKFG
jgi:hypothetical protein